MILVGAGYPGGIVVPEDKPGITIRGVDRNAVVFDGSNQFANAIEVEADDVTLENMTAHDYMRERLLLGGRRRIRGPLPDGLERRAVRDLRDREP